MNYLLENNKYMKYFTSDPHLGHHGVLKYRDVPAKDIQEFNKWIINRIYDIPSGSDLYILGDFAWDKGSFIQLLNKKPRNMQLHLIEGNHDKKIGNIHTYKGIASYAQYRVVKDLGHEFFLCHYPLKVWDKSHYNSINLYGHIHAMTPQIKQEGRQLNVNCEFWDYKPLSSEFIIEYLKGIDNWDYLEMMKQRSK
jgi:calcineurin-like phosphoesterase family protein